MSNENKHHVRLDMRDLVVDVETAAKIMALTKDAKAYEIDWNNNRSVHIGPLGSHSIEFRILTATEYAEGLINGPKT